MPTILVPIILAILIITTVFAAVRTIAFQWSQGSVVKIEGMARMVKFCAQRSQLWGTKEMVSQNHR